MDLANQRQLVAALRRDRQARVVRIDGWAALPAYVPPQERRGVVLVDPSFEQIDEFDRLEEVFPAASYQYVLYGMGFASESNPEDVLDTELQATRTRQDIERQTADLRSRLPTNRDLLNKIREFGLQPV